VSPDLSFLHLVLEASLVVQLIMLVLLLVSMWSWTVIFRKRVELRRARREVSEFESTFWSGTDLTSLYSNLGKDDGAKGLRAIFLAGFREFLRSRSSPDVGSVVTSSNGLPSSSR